MPSSQERKALDIPAGPVNKKQFCQHFKCSPKFVEREVKDERLRAMKFRRKVIFLPSDIQEWLEKIASTEVAK